MVEGDEMRGILKNSHYILSGVVVAYKPVAYIKKSVITKFIKGVINARIRGEFS